MRELPLAELVVIQYADLYMKHNHLSKAKEYLSKTPRAFQQHISNNAEKLFEHIQREQYTPQEMEVLVFDKIVEQYKAFKLATEFIEALEKKDIEKMKSLFQYLDAIPYLEGHERNQKIMYMRLIENIPLVAVGEKYGISRERVRQIVCRAVSEMLCHIGVDRSESCELARKLVMKK